MNFDLRQALGNEEFFLEYQPLVDIRIGELVGAEALLHWQHPQLGVISPVNFIERLESSGQIVSVGEWVLQAACEQWSKWIKKGIIPSERKISVNMSPRQCQQSDFFNKLWSILGKADLQPWSLGLELTESVLLECGANNNQMMSDLKLLGVNIALDDFGTGFSSLCYLTKFPIDRLKIDKSFVSNISHDRSSEAIAVAIISLANNFGLEVVAEGVDEQEKIDLLCVRGCDLFHGIHLSAPMRAKKFVKNVIKIF